MIEVPDEAPPTELETEDIVTGDGPEAKAGDQISVQYVGVDYETGTQFDASWDNGAPFDFELGSGSVIPGWDEGIVGMKVGGRRELVIARPRLRRPGLTAEHRPERNARLRRRPAFSQ